MSAPTILDIDVVVRPIPSTTLRPPRWRWSTTVYWSGHQSRHEYGESDTLSIAWACVQVAAHRLADLGPVEGLPGSPLNDKAAQRWEAAEMRRALGP